MSKLLSIIFCFLHCFILESSNSGVESRAMALEDPLYLTPYLQSEQIEVARTLATVKGISPHVESYSGFITVNETTNANVFFWFIPAATNTTTAPIVLWLEGGPGVTGLYAVFRGNGPYFVKNDAATLEINPHSWHLSANMIFLDNPVGTGFSFANSTDGFLTSSTDASHTYNFLTQFFKMFPEYRENDFYAAGVSFGGVFAPSLGHRIHTVNNEGDFKINFKGLFLESPWSDPIRQFDYANFLYQTGFLSAADRDYVAWQIEQMVNLIGEEKYAEADKIWEETLMADNSFFTNRTGLSSQIFYNFAKLIPEEYGDGPYIEFLEHEYVRNALHVGSTPFLPWNPLVKETYVDRALKSVKPLLEELLDAPEDYRVLFQCGQNDIGCSCIGVRNMANNLSWEGAEAFGKAQAEPWKVNDHVAGFVTTAGKMNFVVMRNAGHDVNFNQPEWTLDLITRFTRNFPFV